MSHNFLEIVDEEQLSYAWTLADAELARHEFDRLSRFASRAHAKGADIADEVRQKILLSLPYRLPILSLVGVQEKPSVFTGFMEGIVPTKQFKNIEAARTTRAVLDGALEAAGIVIGSGDNLQENRVHAQAALHGRLNGLFAMRPQELKLTSVDLVLLDSELDEVEQGFIVPIKVPAVRLAFVPYE